MSSKKAIVFQSDKVKISGPKVDGSYTASFDIPEYEQIKAAGLLLIPQMTIMKVTVEVADEN